MLDTLRDIVAEQWPGIAGAAATFVIGRWWGRRRARRDFAKKEFRDRFNFSLNRLDGDTLRIRTLRECNVEDVWFNSVMRDRLRAVADETTAQDPILPFTDDERWHFLNVVLNEVSEMFAAGAVRADLGAPEARDDYVICLTNEKDGDMRTWKVRAMVIRKSSLERTLTMSAEGATPQFESPHHATRWRTLQVIAKRYQAHPDQMMTMEIIV